MFKSVLSTRVPRGKMHQSVPGNGMRMLKIVLKLMKMKKSTRFVGVNAVKAKCQKTNITLNVTTNKSSFYIK